MYTFNSVDALCGVLKLAYQVGPGAPGRKKLMETLQAHFEFREEQARKYAWTVLADNSETSAEYVRTNAARLIGTWRASDAKSLADVGYGGNALSSRVEKWTFFDDLTYAYSLDRMAIAMSPWGSWARPSSSDEEGLWAPPDRTGPIMEILVLPRLGMSRKLKVDWLGSSDGGPMACRIDGTRFERA